VLCHCVVLAWKNIVMASLSFELEVGLKVG